MKPAKLVKEKGWVEPRRMGFCAKKFHEFCKRTDLHGYKYIVMRELTLLEKSCWAVAVLVSIICATYFVITAYKWYARNPIVTVIESTHGAIWDVPFPAVTICNVNLISKRAARRMSETMQLPNNISSEQVFESMRLIPLLHTNYRSTSEQVAKLTVLQEVLEFNDISIEQLISTVASAASCKNLVQRCMWKNTVYRCEHLFHQVMTQYSICCTFNYYALDDIETASNTSEQFRPPTPRRVASCGYQTALTVLLNNDLEDYYSSFVASYGSMVLIDNSYNLPDVDSPTRLIGPSMEMFIALTPERTYATAGIRSFHPKDRKCYYSDEVQLSAFSCYTYHNCIIHRKVEILKRSCQCVPYYYPTDDDYRKCNFSDLSCIEHSHDIPEASEGHIECLPDCEHYDYPLEVALGVLASEAPLEGVTFFKDINLQNRSLLNVFFNDLVSTRYRRDVYLNWQNLLASFGGLLSLMLGFTLISAIDFVIFFTLKMGYDMFTSVMANDRHSGKTNNKKWMKNKIFVADYGKNEWKSKAMTNKY